MSLRVVGLDLSLTSTGIAVHEEGCGPEDAWRIRGRGTGPERLVDLRAEIMETVEEATLVLIEGYSYASRNGGERLGELGGVVRVALYEALIPYVEVSPSELKKYATGKGNSPKSDVTQQAVHRSGRTFISDDAADAWWLLQMALAHLGLPHIEMPKPNRAVLERIAWPAISALEARP